MSKTYTVFHGSRTSGLRLIEPAFSARVDETVAFYSTCPLLALVVGVGAPQAFAAGYCLCDSTLRRRMFVDEFGPGELQLLEVPLSIYVAKFDFSFRADRRLMPEELLTSIPHVPVGEVRISNVRETLLENEVALIRYEAVKEEMRHRALRLKGALRSSRP